eukprot:scaffold120872_cov57-Phaeocystis_antarctica.AAC.4
MSDDEAATASVQPTKAAVVTPAPPAPMPKKAAVANWSLIRNAEPEAKIRRICERTTSPTATEMPHFGPSRSFSSPQTAEEPSVIAKATDVTTPTVSTCDEQQASGTTPGGISVNTCKSDVANRLSCSYGTLMTLLRSPRRSHMAVSHIPSQKPRM